MLLCSTHYGDECRDVSALKDYEEDFEETDESTKDSGDEREQQQTDEDGEGEEPKTQRRKEIEAIQKAMNEENQRVGTTQTVLDRRRDDDDDDDGRKLSRGLILVPISLECNTEPHCVDSVIYSVGFFAA